MSDDSTLEKPSINVQLVRSLMSVIFEAFEGVELKDLGDDKKENTALAMTIVTVLRRQMQQDNSVNYIPTALEFVRTVQFNNVEEGQLLDVPRVEHATIEQYIEDIAQPIATVALRIKEAIPKNRDAYLILSLLHFTLFILLSTFSLSTARNVVASTLKP